MKKQRIVLRMLARISPTLSIQACRNLATFFNYKSSMDTEYTCAFAQSERGNLTTIQALNIRLILPSLLSLCLSLCFTSSFAEIDKNKISTNTTTNTSLFSLHTIYAYRDFKFNSSAGAFNNSQGYSNLYMVGGNYLRLNDTLIAGLFVYQLDSALNFQLTPFDSTHLNINNHSFFAHILKRVQPKFFVDVAGGYGQNTINYSTFAPLNPIDGPVGTAKTQGNDWFASIKALYNHTWHDFSFIGAGGVLHGEVSQNQFTYTFISPIPQTEIPQLKTQATLLLESAELNYKLHPMVKPFITGGLMQVVQYANNRPLAGAIAIGALPEITSKKNGFQAGIGVSLAYKQFALRLEQQYYQRGNIYQSNQSIASLKIALG